MLLIEAVSNFGHSFVEFHVLGKYSFMVKTIEEEKIDTQTFSDMQDAMEEFYGSVHRHVNGYGQVTISFRG